jgi:hypothetical protein
MAKRAGIIGEDPIFRNDNVRKYRLSKDRGWTLSRDLVPLIMAKTGLPEDTINDVLMAAGQSMQEKLLDGRATGLPGAPILYVKKLVRRPSTKPSKYPRLAVPVLYHVSCRSSRPLREKLRDLCPSIKGTVEEQYADAQKRALGVKPVKELYERKNRKRFHTRS